MTLAALYHDLGAEVSPVTTLRSELRTARKAHACTVCGREIAAGERHRYWFGIVDDEPQAAREHRRACWDEE